MKSKNIFIKIAAVLAVTAMITSALYACSSAGTEDRTTEAAEEKPVSEAITDVTAATAQKAEDNDTEDKDMNRINILVGEKTFTAELYDNESAREFAKTLPLTVTMSELNGNEKYYYLPNSLPPDPSRPGTIHTGDLMLYGSDCVVLFYKDFRTSYSYTPLGHTDDPTGLANALGSGSVQVTFQF